MNPKTIFLAIAVAIFILFFIPGVPAEDYCVRDRRTRGTADKQFVHPTIFTVIPRLCYEGI